jgi:hypothetical protein
MIIEEIVVEGIAEGIVVEGIVVESIAKDIVVVGNKDTVVEK